MADYTDTWPLSAFDHPTMTAYKSLIDSDVIKLDVIEYRRFTGSFTVKYSSDKSRNEIIAMLKKAKQEASLNV